MIALFGFAHLFARQSRPLAFALLLACATLAAGIALLGVAGWFLTAAALTSAAAAFNLFGPSSLVRGLSLIRILARYGERLVGHDATLRLLGDLREWLFRRLVPRLPLALGGCRHGDLVSRLTADVESVDAVFVGVLAPAAAALLVGSALTVGLALLVPAAAWVFGAGLTTAAVGLPLALVAFSQHEGRRIVEARAALRTAALDAIEGHADLRAFGAGAAALAAFAASAENVSAADRRLHQLASLAGAGVSLAAGATTLGVLWFGLLAVAGGSIGGPVLVGLALAVLAAFEPASALVRGAGRLAAAGAAATRLAALAAAQPAICDPPTPLPLPGGAALSFEAVSFRRRPERPLLDRVSFAVAPGTRVAIVGASGSGKSTLLDLALRLVDPHDGSVRVAGTDLRLIAQADLHRRIALMSQATPVFLGTVRDNLRIGDPDADDRALWAALRQAGLDVFVAGLPDGLETWLGEGGRTLSAGQARRLCLARTLLSPAPILLLDEPTSGLDRETEGAFLDDLATATRGRTVLLVTHAELPPGAVNRTLLLRDGRLRELG